MTQFRRLQDHLRFHRRAFLALPLCMLLGSLSGWLCVSLNGCAVSGNTAFRVGQGSLFLAFPRVFMLPSLMAAALLFHSRRLFCFLFFCKGFSAACALCACAAAGIGVLKAFLPGFVLETLLPLPFMLLLGVLWREDARIGQIDLWPMLPALLPAFVGLLLERLIF